MLRFLFLLAVVPVVELYLLLTFARMTSVMTTILLVITTAVLGWMLVKRQGFLAWFRIREAIMGGRMPTEELADGMMVAFASALLMAPGLMTDTFGFLLLIPTSRAWFRRHLMRYFAKRVRFDMTVAGPDGEVRQYRYRPPGSDGTIDVPFRPTQGDVDRDTFPRRLNQD